MKSSTESCSFSTGDNAQIISISEEPSNESITSVIFPWKNKRPLYVPTSETGRQVSVKSFYLCLIASFLLSSGLQLLIGTVWIYARKVPYAHLIGDNVYMDPLMFVFSSAILCLPASILYWAMHDNKKNYILLPILIIFLIMSLSSLITGGVLIFLNKMKIKFDSNTLPPQLIENHQFHVWYESMNQTIKTYKTNTLYKFSWNVVQNRLKCCGINSVDDWIDTIGCFPDSCCVEPECLNNNIYNRGCLNLIANDIAWGLTFILSLGIIVFLMEAFAIVVASALYIKSKLINSV